MSNYGLKISLPGYDVKTATPEQCAVHSDYANPKIKTNQSPAHFNTINYTFSSDPGNGTTNIATIAHGFSYTPMGIVFVKDPFFTPARFSIMPYLLVSHPIDGYQALEAYTDGTNLKIDYVITNFSGASHVNINGFSYTFKYYLFLESGA